MDALTTLAQSLGIAYASGISVYATVAMVGLADRLGWIGPLPGELGALSTLWVIGLAGALAVIEFLATLIPGVASAWETAHSVIRPPAAAALAVLTAWHGDPALVLAAGLLGGSLGLATHATKVGVRYAIDTSPEPVTNGVANIAELGVVASLAYAVWQHPYISLAVALALLAVMILAVRFIWRTLRQALGALRQGG
ncbi:MAG: DUF4126 domain-containing protein [Gemmatimonadaceae bacterium]